MKRSNFIKSIFAISGIGIASTCVSKPVEVEKSKLYSLSGGSDIKSTTNPKTITINGCTQYLDTNPTFVINGDNICKVTNSDQGLSLEIKKRDYPNFNADKLDGNHASFYLKNKL